MSRRMQRSIAEEFFFFSSFLLSLHVYLFQRKCMFASSLLYPSEEKEKWVSGRFPPSPGTGDYFVLCMLHQYIYIMYISTYVSSIYIIHIYLSTSLMCISLRWGSRFISSLFLSLTNVLIL